MKEGSAPKIVTGTGDTSTPMAPESGSKADGTQSMAPGGAKFSFPPNSSGVKTKRSGNPAPKMDGAKTSTHGGTVSPSPGPLRKGIPGTPDKSSIRNGS